MRFDVQCQIAKALERIADALEAKATTPASPEPALPPQEERTACEYCGDTTWRLSKFGEKVCRNKAHKWDVPKLRPAPPPAEGRSLGEIARHAYDGPESWDEVAQAVRAAVLAEAYRELTDDEVELCWRAHYYGIGGNPSIADAIRKADALRKGAR